jgi:hypothetical protein
MKDSQFWKFLAPGGPILDFQMKLERESEGLTLTEFAKKWSKIIGYSESSIAHWAAGTRKIPVKAIKAAGIEIEDGADYMSSTVAPKDGSIAAGMHARQKVIDKMCGGCALGDRFCRISDCPLRPFSPLPLHPKSITMGWDEEDHQGVPELP